MRAIVAFIDPKGFASFEPHPREAPPWITKTTARIFAGPSGLRNVRTCSNLWDSWITSNRILSSTPRVLFEIVNTSCPPEVWPGDVWARNRAIRGRLEAPGKTWFLLLDRSRFEVHTPVIDFGEPTGRSLERMIWSLDCSDRPACGVWRWIVKTSRLRGLREGAADPWNLIRVMPAKGSDRLPSLTLPGFKQHAATSHDCQRKVLRTA